MWEYRARPVHLVDGDTLDLDVDLGFTVTVRIRVRLNGLDCPELHGPTRAAGQRAMDEVGTWLRGVVSPWPLLLRSAKGDKYGRWLGEVLRVGDTTSLNQHLINSGLALPWNGQGLHPTGGG